MILVDTSVWIDHFRNTNEKLVELLQDDRVLIHSLILGEISCGNLKNRKEILSLLSQLPRADEPANFEVAAFLESKHLYGKGLGYIDIHLLATALLNRVELFTLDLKLQREWKKLVRQ